MSKPKQWWIVNSFASREVFEVEQYQWRNGGEFHHVIEVTPEVRQLLVKAGILPTPSETDEGTVDVTAGELRNRFILNLEHAGFDAYMFKEHSILDNEVFTLSKDRALKLGMSEYEFEARKKSPV